MRAFDRAGLERHAYHIRRHVIQTVATNGEGHAGGALSVADILSVILFGAFRDESDPKLRDKLILSGGHKCLALYGALVELGQLPPEELKTYNHLGTILPGHPDCTKVPAIDFSTGSLGHGLPVGCGYALAAKRLHLDYYTYVVMGDGEQGEGSNWEAAAFAAQNQLDNLIAVLDENRLQINGRPQDICKPTDFEDRYRAFGWNVQSVDGHDVQALYEAISRALEQKGKPSIIVAKTVKGKGLGFMEDVLKYHHWNPDPEQAAQAVEEISQYGREKGWL